MNPCARWAAVIVLLAGITGGAWGQELAKGPFRGVDLKSACIDFTFDPATGALLGVDPSTGTATLYPKAYLDGKNTDIVGPVKVGEWPVTALCKRHKGKSYFVVGCLREGLYVLNADGLKIIKKVPARFYDHVPLAAAARDDDPYVYYMGPDATRLHIRTLTTERVSMGYGHLVLTPDGTRCYQWRSGDVSYRTPRKDTNTGKIRWVDDYRTRIRAEGEPVPDPFGLSVAVGKSLYAPDLTAKLVALDYAPKCFFPARPVIVGVADADVVLASYNTRKVHTKAALPYGFAPDGDKKTREVRVGNSTRLLRYLTRYFADGANGRVLIAYEDKVLAGSLKAMKVPDEPLLYCDVEVPARICVGSRAVIKFKPRDARADVALKDGPKGMTLSGQSLLWTPAPAQAGPCTVTLRLHHGKIERTQTIDLKTDQPYVKVGFAPGGITPGPGGQRIVLWDQAGGDWPYRPDEGRENRSHVAVIDVKATKVLAEKALLYPIRYAAVDSHHVYVVPTEADRVDLLSAKDLSRTKRSHTASNVRDILVVSPKLVLVSTEGGVSAYAVPEFKPVACNAFSQPDAAAIDRLARSRGYPPAYVRRGWPPSGLPEPIHGRWCTAGCLFGPALNKVTTLVNSTAFDALSPQRGATPVAWNRLVERDRLLTAGRRRLGSLASEQTILLADHPAAVSLVASSGDEGRATVALAIQDLLACKVLQRVTLIDRRLTGSTWEQRDIIRRWGRGGSLLASAGRTVFAVVGDRLFIHTLDDATIRQLGVPFEFELPASVVAVDPKGTTKIPHKLRGGEKPFEFELTQAHKGVEIDTATGVVTVNGSALTAEAAAQMVRAFQMTLTRTPRDDKLPSAQEIVSAAAKAAAARFKSLVGRDPGGIPVLVPLRVAASDKNQQVATLDYQVVLPVPAKALVAALDKIVKQIAAERKRYADETAARERMYRQRMQAATRPAADAKRIAELEKRIEALEAKLDLLMKLLKDKDK